MKVIKLKEEKAWFNSWPKDMPKCVDYPKFSLNELLSRKAKENPQGTALVCLDEEYSYQDLDNLSGRFAMALSSLGVVKGDRMGLYLPNIPQFVIGYFGALKAGAVVTSISPMHREREVETQLCDSGANTLIALDSSAPIISAVKAKTGLKNIILTGINQFKPRFSGEELDSGKPGFHSFQELLR